MKSKTANIIQSRLFSQTYETNSSDGFTLIELIVTTIAAVSIVSVSLFIVNNQREDVLTTQGRVQGSQNIRTSLDLIGTDIQLAGEQLHSNRILPVIQLIDGNGPANTPAGHDQLIMQRRLLDVSLLTCAPVQDNDTTIVVADRLSTCGFSDVGPDTDGNEATPNPDGLHDLLNEFKEYRCEDAGASECNRTGAVPTTAGQCTSDPDDNNGCVVAYIVDPNTGFGEFFYYTNELCLGDCTAAIGGDLTALVTNQIAAIPLEATDGSGVDDWNHPNGVYPPGSRIYIIEERHYRFAPPNGNNSGILEMVINNEDDYASPAVAPNGGQALELVNQIASFSVEIETPGINGGGLQTIDTYRETPNLAPPLYNDNWTDVVRSIVIHLEASRPSGSDVVRLPEGGCNFAPFNQAAPYNGGDTVPGLCLSSKYYPRNALSEDL